MNRRVLVIGGPNGAGKTTFAREFLPNDWMLFDSSGESPRLIEWGEK